MNISEHFIFFKLPFDIYQFEEHYLAITSEKVLREKKKLSSLLLTIQLQDLKLHEGPRTLQIV